MISPMDSLTDSSYPNSADQISAKKNFLYL